MSSVFNGKQILLNSKDNNALFFIPDIGYYTFS